MGRVFLNSELFFDMSVLCTQSVGSCLGGKKFLVSTAAGSVQPLSPLKAILQMQQFNCTCLNTFKYSRKEDLLQIKRDGFFKINNVLLQPSRLMTSTPEFKNRDEAIPTKCSSLIRRTSQESAAARTTSLSHTSTATRSSRLGRV